MSSPYFPFEALWSEVIRFLIWTAIIFIGIALGSRLSIRALVAAYRGLRTNLRENSGLDQSRGARSLNIAWRGLLRPAANLSSSRDASTPKRSVGRDH